MKKKYVIMFTTIVLILFSAVKIEAEDNLKKQKVLQALNELAYHASNVLLDEEGKSRCDYNIVQGKWYPYEPAWHTGQIINGLVDAYRVTDNEEYLIAAKKAGNWWTSLLIKDHPKLEGMLYAVHGDHAGEVLVFATISDGTPGLFNLYKATKIDKYAAVPTSAGRWMLEHMYVPEHGVFYDTVDPETGEVRKENSPFWKDKEVQELFDVSRPNNEGSLFKDMYEYTGDEKYKKVFIELCNSLVEKQDEYGLWMDFMPNHKHEGTFHPRFNLWYAESLIDGYELTGDKRYLEAARKTLEFHVKFQGKDGSFHYVNYVDGRTDRGSKTGSAVAFIGILGIRLIEHGVGEQFKDNVERSFNWVIKNRYAQNHPDPNLRGGLINLRSRHRQGMHWITQRDVGTAFGMRFLAKYYEHYFGDENKK